MKKTDAVLHPLPIRLWHWFNAVTVFVLIVTGAELRFTDLRIFPDYGFVVSLHKWAGYFLAFSYLFWIAMYQTLGGFASHYLVSMRDARLIPSQIAYYVYGYFRGRPNPFSADAKRRFNPLQKLAYTFIMFIGMPVIIITGILFGNLMDFYRIIHMLGGIRIVDAIHVIAGYAFLVYIIVHLYMATLGITVFSHTKSMITGREDWGEAAGDRPPVSGTDSEKENGNR